MSDKRAVFDEAEPYPHEVSSADVSPASAGGAPAPNLAALCAAVLPALDAARKVFEAAAGPVVEAEILPADREPEPRDTDLRKLREMANALHALLGEEDCTERAVTLEHLWYLVRLVAGHLDAISDGNRPRPPQSDPRDAEVASLTRDRDRWQAHYNQLIGDALHVQQHLQRALGKPVPVGREFDRGYSRSMVGELAAQRDRLHQELDLIGEKHAAGLVVLRQDFTAAVNGLLPAPAEPNRRGCPCKSQCDYLDGEDRCSDSCDCAAGRSWVAGDAEPEIGVTVGPADDSGRTWTRLPNGSWHPDHSCDRSDCRGFVFFSWDQLPRPLVEVVSTDGE